MPSSVSLPPIAQHNPAIHVSNPTQTAIPSIPLAELPLRPSTLSLLKKRGFVTTAELEDARVNQGMATLAAELDLSLQDTANLLVEIQGCLRINGDEDSGNNNNNNQAATANTSIDTSVAIPPISNARFLLETSENDRNHIVTFCQDIDQLLGGGIALGQLTEIAGLPGTGKTQLAMQLAVLSRLPKLFGGVGGKTLYIDTEGSFAPERCAQMATALRQHIQGTNKYKQSIQQQQQSLQQHDILTERDILESIQVFSVHDEASQTATLQNLPQYLEDTSNDTVPVKLIVIDSVAFHYRAMLPTTNAKSKSSKSNSYQYYGQRTKSLISLAGFLADLARQYHLAVVCVNQMTTKIGMQGGGNNTSNNNNNSVLVPALGESWAHAITTRLLLSQHQQNGGSDSNRQLRTCQLVKSPHRPSGMAHFQILPQGIRRAKTISIARTRNISSSQGNSQASQQPPSQYQPPAPPPRHHRRPIQKQTTPLAPPPQQSLRRPLQPHNLKTPPSYSISTTSAAAAAAAAATPTMPPSRGNNNAPRRHHHPQHHPHRHPYQNPYQHNNSTNNNGNYNRVPIPTPPPNGVPPLRQPPNHHHHHQNVVRSTPNHANAAGTNHYNPKNDGVGSSNNDNNNHNHNHNNNNNNTPQNHQNQRMVTPHPTSNPPTTKMNHPSSNPPSLNGLKRRRIL
ncbi:unnamed protein product [Cylindrotheca closterium]|uniref:DNA repair protein RAD51 homolog 3 n=1 Tax=Cylindrotheca closterium TaxID=2856 RepID=A0AAD2FAS5_9STRA|nr:unnamed protein product [Cylindrotheca closterium]